MSARWTLALCSCLLCGCGASVGGMFVPSQTVKGSGIRAEEARPISAVDEVRFAAAIQGEVRVGPQASLIIQADDNIVPLVVTEVRDGVLRVQMKDNTSTSTSNPIVVRVTVPQLSRLKAEGASQAKVTAEPGAAVTLERIEVNGAARVEVSGIVAPKLWLKADGASHCTLAGQVESFEAEVSGASKLLGEELRSRSAEVNLNGASYARIKAPAVLSGRRTGASRLETLGRPGNDTGAAKPLAEAP